MTLPLNKQFPGFKAILEGPSGTGKTYSLHTLVESGLEVFYLDLDRSLETILGFWVDKDKPIPANFHWHYLQQKTQSMDALRRAADSVGKFDLSTLAKMKDNDRGANNQLVTTYEILNNFIDQRDGKAYGAVDSWGNDRVLVVDALTALNHIVFDMVVGTRPMRDKPDYGIAQNLLSNLLSKLTKGCVCNFVLTAHIERQIDDVLGGVKLLPVTIGQAMKPELPIPFSDVILAKKVGNEWTWSTADGQADLKTRNLPYSDKLPADFRPLVATWSKRRDAFEAAEKGKVVA